MRIVFHLSPEPGHLAATVPLARALARRGHDIVYTAIEDVRPEIEALGFRAAPIHHRAVPRGTRSALARAPSDEARDWAAVELGARIADDYFRGAIEAIVQPLDPAIVIADVATFSPIQFALHRLGVPCLQLSISLSQRHDELPPLTSSLTPDAPPLNLAGARWEASCLHRTVGPLRIPMIVAATAERYAARFGYPSAHISFDAVLDPALTAFPEAIACAAALDLPRTGAAPSFLAIPLERAPERDHAVPAALASFLDRARPLVYASLGDWPGRSPRGARLLEAVTGALEANPAWQAVLVAGPNADPALFAKLPRNALWLSHVPGRWLLGRAAVLVTHAAIGEIREAIAQHVPIIAVPQRRDQPGNAARVAHHGIGVQLPPDLITGAGLTAAIQRVIAGAGAYRARLAALDDACRAEEAEQRGVALVERLAVVRTRGAPGASHAPAGITGLGWKLIDAPAPDAATLTIYRTLGDALAHAEGSRLARVQVSDPAPYGDGGIVGQAPRWLRVDDVSDALHDYAAWCATAAFEPDLAAAAERVELFRGRLAQHRALRRQGAPADQLTTAFHATRAQAVKYWHHGYGAAAFATDPVPYRAAQLARVEAMLSLARHAVADLAGTAEGADRCEQAYRGLIARFDAELERRLALPGTPDGRL